MGCDETTFNLSNLEKVDTKLQVTTKCPQETVLSAMLELTITHNDCHLMIEGASRAVFQYVLQTLHLPSRLT